MAAITADKVMVELSAPTAKYINDTKAAEAAFDSWARSAAGDAAAIEAAGLRADRAMDAAASSSFRASRGISAAGGSTANLAAQLQDIGVQLAAGQSPFLIALQQGTQINQVIGQSGAAGAVKLLGAAFASLINPVSLATIGIITLGGLAVQYFTTLISDGKVSEETLKKQNDLIRDVADKWGEAVPALKAYVDELDRAKEAEDRQTAAVTVQQQAFNTVRTVLEAMTTDILLAVETLQAMGNEGGAAADKLNSEFGRFAAKVADGSARTEDFDRILKAISDLATTTGVPAFSSLAAQVGALAQAFAAASQQAEELEILTNRFSREGAQRRDLAKFIGEQERVNTLTEEQLDLENEIARVQAEAERAGIDNLSEAEATRLAKERLAAEERRSELRKEERAAVKVDSATDREAKAVLDLIAALEYEQAIMGLSKEDQAVMSALRRAGAAATDEQRARIEELVRATAEEAEAMRQTEQILNSIRDAAANALTTFISDLREGKSAGEALAHVLDDLAGRLLDVGINLLLSGLTGGIGGGATSFAGQFFNSVFGGARAGGGPVEPGRIYRVGEDGPEAFIPRTSGTIVPNAALRSGGGQSRVVIELGAGLEARMLQTAGEQSVQIVRATVPGMIDRRAPTSVAQAQRNRVA